MKTTIKLREWREEDIPSLTELANNKKIFDNVRDSFPYPYTEQDAKLWIEKNKNVNPATAFAITIDGKAIGAVGIMLKNDVYKLNAELGYWLGEPYWNKGITTLAVQKMVDYTFKTFPVKTISAFVFEFNKPSMQVLTKCGFRLEAVMKKWVIKNGVVIDEYLFTFQKE